MIRLKTALVIVAAATLCGIPNAGAAERESGLRAPQANGPAAAPFWLAQSERTVSCTTEGRKVPSGSLTCREGTQWLCNARGTWEKKPKPC
jgi:hypothetical protein